MTTSWRGSRIWRRQTHSVSSPGGEVAPEHRPRREAPAVRVELVAAGPAPLEPRAQQVHEPLGVAQLRGRSCGRSRGGGGARPGTRRRARSVSPSISPPSSSASRAELDAQRRELGQRGARRPRRPRRTLPARPPRGRRRGSRPPERTPGSERPPAAPEPVEDAVVDLAVVAAPDEDRRARVAHLLPVAEVDEGRAHARSRWRPPGRPGGRPPAAPARSPRPRRAGGGRRWPRRWRRPGSGSASGPGHAGTVPRFAPGVARGSVRQDPEPEGDGVGPDALVEAQDVELADGGAARRRRSRGGWRRATGSRHRGTDALARSTTAPAIGSMAQPAASATRRDRRTSVSAALSGRCRASRRSVRSHSISVEVRHDDRRRGPEERRNPRTGGSSRSQARTALVSA